MLAAVKRWLRGPAAALADVTGLSPARGRASGRAIVAMYHRVLPRDDADFRAAHPGMVVSLEAFRMHLDEYRAHYDVVTFGELVRRAAAGPLTGRPLLALTFDDGWIDTYALAAPDIAARGLTATVFVAKCFVESAARGEAFAGVAQLRELQAAGWEIGSHTWSHRELQGVAGAELEQEVVGSKGWIEDALGTPVASFAYPRGKYDATSSALVRRTYDAAVTVESGYFVPECDRALVPRIGIHDAMTSTRARLRWRLAGLP